MKGRLLGILAGLLATLLSAAATIAQNSTPPAVRPVKFITSLPTLTVAVPFTMLARQFDRAHGLAVEVQYAGGSSTIMIDAVLSGSAEFASPGAATALQAIREGADLKIIAAIANNQIAAVISNGAAARLGVSPTAPFAERIRAFRGLTIGTNPLGATYYQMLRTYLKQYGLSPDRDVRLVGIAESSALISGIKMGRFDAIVSASGVVEQAIAQNAGILWFSAARGDIPVPESPLVSVIVTRTDTIARHRDHVDALLAALSGALNAVRNEHTATGQLLKEAYFQKLDPAVWDMVWNAATLAYPPNLMFPRAAYDYWIANDPKGADSFRNLNYQQIVYAPAQSP
jgi:NitT/TauT family transport system substrate-binding protein